MSDADLGVKGCEQAQRGHDLAIMEPNESKLPEHLDMFERARDLARLACDKDPQDATALTVWAAALLEIAHHQEGDHAIMEMCNMARPLSYLSCSVC